LGSYDPATFDFGLYEADVIKLGTDRTHRTMHKRTLTFRAKRCPM
jgi:hypothetical protein